MAEENFELDPKGYFLIRIIDKEIEVGFCNYEAMVWGKSNKVLMQFKSSDVKEILDWIKKNDLTSMKNHFNYMKKELEKAKKCIETHEEYVQS